MADENRLSIKKQEIGRRRFGDELWVIIEQNDADSLISFYTHAFKGNDKITLSRAIKALQSMDIDLIQPISKLLETDVEAAIFALGEIGGSDEAKLLTTYLKNNNSRIREAAVRAIGLRPRDRLGGSGSGADRRLVHSSQRLSRLDRRPDRRPGRRPPGRLRIPVAQLDAERHDRPGRLPIRRRLGFGAGRSARRRTCSRTAVPQ